MTLQDTIARIEGRGVELPETRADIHRYAGLDPVGWELLTELDNATAEVESLKCCGNCGHWVNFDEFFNQRGADNDGFICDCSSKDDVHQWFETDGASPCIFTPSRWDKRGAAQEHYIVGIWPDYEPTRPPEVKRGEV